MKISECGVGGVSRFIDDSFWSFPFLGNMDLIAMGIIMGISFEFVNVFSFLVYI